MEIKPGWYRMRNGEIAYIAAIRTDNVAYQAIGWTICDCEQWTTLGEYFQWQTNENDLIEPLPSCTGFDWKPEPKYVPFTRETFPRDAWVVHFATCNDQRATELSDDAAYIGGRWLTWKVLLDGGYTIDGKPAGRLES